MQTGKKKLTVKKKKMTKANSLGFVIGGENVQISVPTAKPESAPPARSMLKYNNMACCVLTALLFASGLAVGVWYAVTESM